MKFILVSGPPASGKTIISRLIGKELKLPFFSKDSFKEVLFDAMEGKHAEHAPQIGRASFALLYHALETQLRAACTCIVEANFRPAVDTQPLQRLHLSIMLPVSRSSALQNRKYYSLVFVFAQTR